MAPENVTLATPPAEEIATLKTQFLASLNHEVRTPLTGIVGMTDLLLETALSQEQREYVDAARHCAGDLLAIFNKTLEFSDLSSGRVILERHEFHLPEVLRNAVSAHVPAARDKGLKLSCRLPLNLPETAVGDAVRLGQLVFYMVENAVKFTERGKVQVLVAAHVKDARLQLNIKVQDTGIGIAPDKLEMVFESFRQLDGGLARAYGGLGLGLPLVQKLTLLMGGHVSVESQPGVGSEFSVTIPLEQAGGLKARGSNPQRRILLVEDDEVACKVVSHILKRAGYALQRASSGLEAIQTASANRYDLILMDLQMPGMDGLKTTARIRDLPEYASTPIVALTVNVTAEHRRMCFASGMQAFVPKPVQAEELLSVLKSLLP